MIGGSQKRKPRTLAIRRAAEVVGVPLMAFKFVIETSADALRLRGRTALKPTEARAVAAIAASGWWPRPNPRRHSGSQPAAELRMPEQPIVWCKDMFRLEFLRLTQT